uniref:Reverse transcriptase domain-containing protein n=1 Tax=Tanacetum cinerariifolium TaxID=118510 RepID=A0A6L2JDR7_TANCI|nr:hypothetical protein [Tanacetum cinerariifolium]
MDLTKARENQFLQIIKLDEMRLDDYESSISYMEINKRWHDKQIKAPTNYERGDKKSRTTFTLEGLGVRRDVKSIKMIRCEMTIRSEKTIEGEKNDLEVKRPFEVREDVARCEDKDFGDGGCGGVGTVTAVVGVRVAVAARGVGSVWRGDSGGGLWCRQRGDERRWLESRLEEKKRTIYGMCSIIPKPRRRHCPEGKRDVSSQRNESPLILVRPFLRTARALIDVHGEEMIFRDGDERLTLNVRHDTSSYSNQPQKESINMINIYDDSSEDFLKNLFATNHQSGNPTFSSHPNLTSPEVKDDVFDPEGGNVLIKKLLDLDLHPTHNVNPLSGSTTFSAPNHLLEEFTDELALITFPPGNDDLPFDIESNLKEIEYLLNHDPIKDIDSILEDSVDEDNLADLNDNLADTMPEMFTDEHALDYSSPPLYNEYDDDLFEVESDTEYVYNDPFDSKGEKIKESKLLINELDLPRSSDFLPSPESDSFLFEDFSKVDALPSTNNEDKVFNPGILIQENLFEVNTRVEPDKNIEKIAISHAYLILEDFDPPLYELPFLKEVPGSETLLSFSSENKEKVFKPGILTSKGFHSSLIPKLSHQGYNVFKIIKILKIPMEFFLFSCGENIRILDVPCLHFYPP